MKTIKRSLSLVLCAVSLLLLLAACGGGSTPAKDVPVADLAKAVSDALGKTDLASSDGMFLGMTKKTAEELGEHLIQLNVYGTNIDEFGIFKAGAMTTEQLKAAADDYLSKRLASWMDEYMPEEKPKLTGAEARIVGNCVMYCILSEADKDTAFQALENAMK